MIFFAQKILRKISDNWTFVIVTDRKDLDTQIYKNFANTGVVTEEQAQATSSTHLRQLLGKDHRYIFTLIQKFRAGKRETQSLNEEETRCIAEQLSEEGLAIFDLLTRPEIELSEQEKQQVRKVDRELLNTLKQEKFVLDWRKHQQSRAAVRVTIEKILDRLPQCYTQELYGLKCDLVYQHIYDSYFGPGQSVYAPAAPAV